MKFFITPLIKVHLKAQSKVQSKVQQSQEQVIVFFDQREYCQWVEQNPQLHKTSHSKYYKGLGTSTSQEAKQYFKQLDQHMKRFVSENVEADTQSVDLAFNKKRANDRKEWLANYQPGNDQLDYKNPTLTYEKFINKELIQFSIYDCKRSIPSVMDGLKPGQRKILFSCFKRNLKDQVKVAQLSGYVSEHSAYHHGEQSLQQTIIQMAQDFVGSNNVNLLMPIGQFGNRNLGTDGAASPRYIYTKLNPLTTCIYNKQDNLILNFLEEEGHSIEPEFYAPIIPMVLVNGAMGIGTGWSTDIPPYSMEDIINYILYRLGNDQPDKQCKLSPWYKGFTGSIIKYQDGFILRGNIRRQEDLLIIEEIPATEIVQKYKKILNDLIDNDFIQHYTEHHSDNKVCFKITGLNWDGIDEQDIYDKFKLQTKVSTKNLVLFDAKGKIRRYENEIHIFEDYFATRLIMYSDRKQALLKQLELICERISNKYRFILCIINLEITILGTKHQQLTQQLQEMQFSVIEGSFDYLTSMPIHYLTFEYSEKLRKEKEEVEVQLEQLKASSPQDLWVRDINDLVAALQSD